MSKPNRYDLANPEPTAALDLFETFHDAEGRRIVIKYLDFVHKLLGSDKKQTAFFLKWQASCATGSASCR